jgi:digeranylgeranylglycerophospholipid reductase
MGYDSDVLVIGAGPAGLAAARQLTMLDVSFILIHREKSPCEKKVCGGFIPQRALERFGIEDFKGAYIVDAVRMRFPSTETEIVEFNEPVGVNATRYNMGRAQLSSINQSGRVWPETEATRVDISGDECLTRFVRKDETGVISSKVLIDASGVNPVTQRFASIRKRIPNTSMGYAVQYQMRLGSDSKLLRGVNDFIYGSDFSPGGYAWAFPRGKEVAVGTGGLIDHVRKSEKRVEEYLEHLLTTNDLLKNELENATMYKRESALMSLAGVVRPSHSNRLMLAGDAAGHCSPITGEGIFYAMLAGEAAALTAMKSLHRNDYSAYTMADYEKRWVSKFGSDLKWGLWLQHRFLKSGSSSLGSQFLSSEKSSRIIAEMLIGKRSVRSAILNAVPGYIRSKLRA